MIFVTSCQGGAGARLDRLSTPRDIQPQDAESRVAASGEHKGMKIVKLAAAALAASALWTALPAQAQQSTRAMPTRDCNKTLLALNPAVTCIVPHYVNQSKVSTQDSFITGTVGNTAVYMV